MVAQLSAPEVILEPELPIIDPHHHLWDRRPAPASPEPRHGFTKVIDECRLYLLDELLADLKSGHNVRGTVFLECGAFFRADAPEQMKPVGETEFVNGVAAMSASGLYGDVRACAGIVGRADLRLCARVEEVLEAHIRAGGGRFRGVRNSCSYDPDPNVLGPLAGRVAPNLYVDLDFRTGFKVLGRMGLSFDAWLLEPQLPELIALVRACPDTPVVLDHVGTPLGIGTYKGRLAERFGTWRENIRELAKSQQVSVKLGGLAMAFCGFASFLSTPPATSEQLAREWKPYVETCIEAFGAERCMFESNFPVDSGACTYPVLWNAFKRIAHGYSPAEKNALFAGTARRFYKLAI